MRATRSLAPTRRHFLLGGAAVGATATSAPAILTGCTALPQARGPSAPDWAALARDLNGRLVRKDDPDYGRFARPYNLAYDTPDRMPQGIALCATPADVSTSIKWAKDNGIALRTRAGGHSYAGYSTTPDFMIDVSTMRSITWDPSTKRVTAASGAHNGDLYKALQAENRLDAIHGARSLSAMARRLLRRHEAIQQWRGLPELHRSRASGLGVGLLRKQPRSPQPGERGRRLRATVQVPAIDPAALDGLASVPDQKFVGLIEGAIPNNSVSSRA